KAPPLLATAPTRPFQSPAPVGINWKSSVGTASKNALCSLWGNGHSTGVGWRLVSQFLQPPTHTVPGNAVPRRARNFSVASTVGATAARRGRASVTRPMKTASSLRSPAGARFGNQPHDARDLLVETERHRHVIDRSKGSIKHEQVGKVRHGD